MARQPNIVVILTDDMGYGDVGVFGNPAVRTRAIDQLAAEGLCLTQHYSGSAVCAPARAALLTGRYPHRTGAIDTLESRGLDRLALREVTLADRLRAAGYVTGLVGKWHLGALDPRYHPNARGFDEFAGFRGGWIDYWDYRLDYNGSIREADGRYATDVFTEEAVAFLARHHREPFFLHVAYNAPHFPLEAPEAEVRLFRESGRLTEAVSTIYAMNHRIDEGVGNILEALRGHGLLEDTFLLFTSDNGPQFGGQGERCADRYNGHFNGSKGTVYEGGIRVPAIVRWPAGLPAVPGRLDTFMHFTDWLPTLLAVAGVEPATPPHGMPVDGIDALPLLRGESAGRQPRHFWQWNRYTPVGTCNAAMRDGAWKLVRPRIDEAMRLDPEHTRIDQSLKQRQPLITEVSRDPEPVRHLPPPPPALLFRLDQDPYEQYDLAHTHPEQVARMEAALTAWFAEVEADRAAIRDDMVADQTSGASACN